VNGERNIVCDLILFVKYQKIINLFLNYLYYKSNFF
jgi:hypothetical protein